MRQSRRVRAAGGQGVARQRWRAEHVNIDDGERWASFVGGGLLLLFGVSRRGRLGIAAAVGGGALMYRAARGHSQIYEALGLDETPVHVARVTSLAQRRGVTVRRTISINKPAEEVYAFWRDFENLPRFMRHLESVRKLDERRSHWVAKAPAGTSVEWDAEITRDEPGALLSWRSIEGSEIDNAGAVRFLAGPAGRGALVSVTMQYRPPGGALGAAFAKLFGEEPEQQVRDDLRRFKQLLETGEIPTTEGQPHGQRPAWYRAMGGTQR